MERKELSRRELMGRAGAALGGAVLGVGLIEGCASGSGATRPAAAGAPSADGVAAAPRVADFPYQRHLPPGYRLDAAAIEEAAYHAYYVGGCCHGSYSALLGHLAATAGAPFNLMPLDFGKFGAGGIAGYGSICGAVLGSVMVVNMTIANPAVRNAMITDLMRWYEGASFPAYVPAAVDAAEKGVTLDFSPASIARLQVVPKSHLCHASVSGWCAVNRVSAEGPDKKARCGRLTADVAGKTAEMLNAQLAGNAYKASAIDAVSAGCLGCHGPKTTSAPVAAGMACAPCHTDKVTKHP